MTDSKEQMMQLVLNWRHQKAELYDLVFSIAPTAQTRSVFDVLAEMEKITEAMEAIDQETATSAKAALSEYREMVTQWFKFWWPSS